MARLTLLSAPDSRLVVAPASKNTHQSGEALGLGVLVRAQLNSLIEWAKLPKEIRVRLASVFDILTDTALDRLPEPPFKGLSFINANGLPFQWVFRFGEARTDLGFLCEVGRPEETPQQRLRLSFERLGLACDACNIKRPEWLPGLITLLVPGEGESWPKHWRSAMWVGVAASKSGIQLKPYFNLNRDTPRERWLRAGWILKGLGRDSAVERLCDLSRRASEGSLPTGLAVDVLPDGSAGRVKIYFRSEAVREPWLEKWYSAAGYEQHFGIVRRCLDLFAWLGRRPYPEGAFILSVEFHSDDGSVSLKTDFGVTKWIASDERVALAMCGLISAVNGELHRLQSAIETLGAWPPDSSATTTMRFVGLGSEPDGSCHVNLYVQPPLRTTRHCTFTTERRQPAEAISSSLRFLMSARCDALWADFRLPVGESHAWVTAYVLARLGELKSDCIPGETRQMIEESLDWLVESRTPRGGWGYNATVEDDADSTSWAILALRSHGRQIPDDALRLVRRCERPDGGFATYPEGSLTGGAWTLSVPDVTAVVMSALGSTEQAKLEPLFWRWLRADGSLAAYWWATPLYTWSALLDCPGRVTDSPLITRFKRGLYRYKAQNTFEEALMLRCLVRLQIEGVSSAAEELLRSQQANGSWAPSALLRLTAPEVIEPWNVIDAGPLYSDHNAVFTTATALSALALYVNKFE